jgi:hypothetical protein
MDQPAKMERMLLSKSSVFSTPKILFSIKITPFLPRYYRFSSGGDGGRGGDGGDAGKSITSSRNAKIFINLLIRIVIITTLQAQEAG